MPKELVDDELWSLIEPLLPVRAPRNRQYAGRKPIPDRAVLTGIVFVLRSGIAWNLLPQEMGCGSGTACWRRLDAWQKAGVWQRIHETLLAELRRRGEIDLTRALVDSSSIRAMLVRKKTGPNPTGRRKLGSKHHLIVDAQGIPLAVILTGANLHDITQLDPLVETIPHIRGKRGRPLHKPKIVQGDRGATVLINTVSACEPVASNRCSQKSARTMAAGLVKAVGRSNARSLGCTRFGA